MKKWTGLSALLLLFSMTLSACSSGSTSSDATAESTTSTEKVTLTYGMWDKNYQPAMEKIIDTFEQSHPNISVNIQLTPFDQYWNKLNVAATGDSLPDVFWMNGPNALKYISNDILMPLDDLTQKGDIQVSNFPGGLVDLYKYNNSQYGIPFEMSTIGLWYNKTLFKNANVAVPDDTWDWDKVKEAAAKLTDKNKGIWGIGAQQKNQQGYYDTILQAGGYIISPDKKKSGYDLPASIEGLEYWTDFIKAGDSPTAAQMSQTDPVKLFESGKLAMLYDGSWDVGEYANNEYTKANVNVAKLPKGKEDTQVIHGAANVISAKTAHPQEAQQFLTYLSSKEANEIFASFGSGIPAFNGTQSAWVKSVPEFNLQVFIDAATTAKPYPVSKDTAAWLALEDEYFTKAWYGQMSVADAAKEVASKMNDILAKE